MHVNNGAHPGGNPRLVFLTVEFSPEAFIIRGLDRAAGIFWEVFVFTRDLSGSLSLTGRALSSSKDPLDIEIVARSLFSAICQDAPERMDSAIQVTPGDREFPTM